MEAGCVWRLWLRQCGGWLCVEAMILAVWRLGVCVMVMVEAVWRLGVCVMVMVEAVWRLGVSGGYG